MDAGSDEDEMKNNYIINSMSVSGQMNGFSSTLSGTSSGTKSGSFSTMSGSFSTTSGTNSAMSGTMTGNDEIKCVKDENENEFLAERIAVEALGGLKQQPFLKRVQNIPLVGRTVSSISNAYESTKNRNNVLKYSAESVESLSSLITKPVLYTLEPVLRPLDRFASNQLDKVFYFLFWNTGSWAIE